MDKQAIATITQAAEWLEKCAKSSDAEHGDAENAKALRDLLPKPRFYAEHRQVWERDRECGGAAHTVKRRPVPDDATAHLIAQDIAASYNQRLGEVES
jgi:hypothetical protein